jgi:HD-GYP domain-containing protein (c-di-GMP phosphodiesterase class II)
MPTHDVTPADAETERLALGLYQETFGTRFTTWTCVRHSWSPLLADAVGGREQDLTAARLQELNWQGTPLVAPISSDRMLIVLPMDPYHWQRAAVGILNASDHRLTERLAAGAHRLLHQQLLLTRQGRELTTCLEQLTFSMEEQTWLRTLSRRIDLSDVRVGTERIVSEILPKLRSLIAAEGVAWIASEQGAAGPGGSLRAEWVGDRRLKLSACRHLIACYGHRALVRAVVAQEIDAPRQLGPLGIRSMILAPVLYGEQPTGWLLAVNRCSSVVPIVHSTAQPSVETSDAEFGSIEAGLLEATATMLGNHARNSDLLHQREEMVIRLMKTMSSAIDARDAYTRGHSQRVGRYAHEIARQLRLPDSDGEQLYLTGLLHDVGKIGVPDHVLLKPGRLSPEEFELIKQHPEIGHRILEPIAELGFALPGVLHHHERMDGQGYPHGLAGDEIPLMARILAVADAFDAMTSSRTYRAAMSRERAREILEEGAGVQWDAELVSAFLQTAGAQGAADEPDLEIRHDTEVSLGASIFDDDGDVEDENWQNHSMLLEGDVLEATHIMAGRS